MTSNSSNVSLQDISLQTLAQLYIAHIFWTLLGSMGIASNIVIMLAIVKSPILHNRSQYVIFSHSFAEFCFSSCVFGIGLKRCVGHLLQRPDLQNKFDCLLTQMPLIVSSKAAMFAILALGLDRLMSISMPIFYKLIKPIKYIFLINIISWSIPVVMIPFAFADQGNKGILPFCTYAAASSSNHRTIESMLAYVVICITIVVYLIAIAMVGYRYWGTKWLNEAQKITWAREIHLGAFKMMMTVGMLFLLCWGVGIVFTLVASSRPNVAKLGPYVGLFYYTNGITNVFVYAGFSKNFRRAIQNVILCQKWQVHVVGGTM